MNEYQHKFKRVSSECVVSTITEVPLEPSIIEWEESDLTKTDVEGFRYDT